MSYDNNKLYRNGKYLTEKDNFYHFISVVKIEDAIYPIRWTIRKPLAEN